MSVTDRNDTVLMEEPPGRSGHRSEPAAAVAQYTPYFLDGMTHVPVAGDAYVRVRVFGKPTAGGLITVYLVDGTALLVPYRDLLKLVPSGSSSEMGHGFV